MEELFQTQQFKAPSVAAPQRTGFDWYVFAVTLGCTLLVGSGIGLIAIGLWLR